MAKETTTTTGTSRIASLPITEVIGGAQLVLAVDNDRRSSWHIDDETREIGRRGLAHARAVLHASRPFPLDIAA